MRLLDPRRLPELGHRARASSAGTRARSSGSRRRRCWGSPAARSWPATARGRSRCSTAPSSSSTAGPPAPAASRRRTRSTSPRSTTTSPAPCSPPRGCRPTPPRRCCSAWAGCAGSTPPPLYAFDPDVGRLAVTTPSYNTAVVAVNRGAFPYGGLELARLFDVQPGRRGRHRRAPAGVLRRRRPRRRGQDRAGLAARGDRLRAAGVARAEVGAARRGRGRFSRLRVAGSVSKGGTSIRTEHRFESAFIETEWRVSGAALDDGRGAVPELGRGRARDRGRQGRLAPLRSRRRRVAGQGRAGSTSRASTRATSSCSAAARARASTQAVASQSSAPHPGPTLTVRTKSTVIVARLAPAKTAEEARTVADALA